MTDRPIVIKIGGSVLDEQLRNDALWRAIGSLRTGGGVILVHGGGKALDRQLGRLNVVSERCAGLRITPEDQMDDVAGVLAGSVNVSIVGALARAGVPAVGLALGSGPLVHTSKMTEPDLGRVGVVHPDRPSAGAAILRAISGAGAVPVVSSIGIDAQGMTLNINADDAAAGVAVVTRARALVLLSDVSGVKDRSGSVIPRLRAQEIESLIETGVVSGGMIPKLRSAAITSESIGGRVVILSGASATDLLRWIEGEAVGTEIEGEA